MSICLAGYSSAETLTLDGTLTFTGWGNEPSKIDAGTLSFTGWASESVDSVGTLTFTGWGDPAPRDVVGTLSFVGLGPGDPPAAVEVRFSGWNRVAPFSGALAAEFHGWSQSLSVPDQQTSTFAGWNRPAVLGEQRTSFSGWNRAAPVGVQSVAFKGWRLPVNPGVQSVSFSGIKHAPPLCSPDELGRGDKLKAPVIGANGNQYQLFTCETDWHAAVQACASVGAHLMTITSASEQDIATKFSEDCGLCWLGLTDADSEGNFVWITGEPLGFTNWGGGEPNNHCENEDFVHMYSGGTWNDQQADGGCNSWGLMGYVCEWESQ